VLNLSDVIFLRTGPHSFFLALCELFTQCKEEAANNLAAKPQPLFLYALYLSRDHFNCV